MSLGAAVAAMDSRRRPRPVSPQWQTIGATVGAPMAYAIVFNVSFRADEHPLDGPDGAVVFVLVGLKLAAIVALVVGLHRIGDHVDKRPAVAAAGAGVWASAGVGLVAISALAKERGVVLGVDHLWPAQSDPELVGHLRPGPGPGWRASSIVTAEILAVLVLALGIAALLMVLARRPQRAMMTGLVAVGLLCGLLTYDQIVGWSVLFDFDPFVGDAVLGILTYELVMFFGPVDPLGAVALATIAAANGLILAGAKIL